MAKSKSDSNNLKDQPLSSILPQVSAEESATLREQISQRTFNKKGGRWCRKFLTGWFKAERYGACRD